MVVGMVATVRTAAAVARPHSDLAAGRLFKVLGDPTRLGVLRTLAAGPATVVELLMALGNPPRSRVSNHLACLAHCGLVTAEPAGRTVVYTLARPEVLQMVDLATEVAAPNAEHLASCTRIGPAWV